MASSVYYKFKSQRNESKVSFDGTGISVFDLKREIILSNNLKSNDFDIQLYDPSTGQEYKDDSHIIPRSSSVIAKRVPAPRAGKGKAAMYLEGAPKDKGSSASTAVGRAPGVMSKRFNGKDEPVKGRPKTPTMPTSVSGNDEAAAMAAMFKAQTENWEETQEKMSQAVPIYNSARGVGRGGKPFAQRQQLHHQPDRPLPPSYVCYRCGQKGHWIQDCPTNNDRDYDNRPRIKRTTGIPRSFLKTVEQPSEGKIKEGVMVTPEGSYVVAQPDLASWQKQLARSKAPTVSEIREKTPTDATLACPIDNKLFKNAMKTPCCGTTFCEDCIVTHLVENDFVCPKCKKNVPSLEKLVVDKPTRTKVGDYIDKMIRESQEAVEAIIAEGAEKDGAVASASDTNEGGEFDQQLPLPDVTQLLTETIPQLQAQLQQLSVMLQNPSLPPQVRQSTEYQYQQLQNNLAQAHAFAALTADLQAVAQAAQQQQQQQQQQQAANFQQGMMQGEYQSGWSGQFPHAQPAGQDSAYQRLPVNNRRRNVKRERPSDFLEIGGGEVQMKFPKYWE